MKLGRSNGVKVTALSVVKRCTGPVDANLIGSTCIINLILYYVGSTFANNDG